METPGLLKWYNPVQEKGTRIPDSLITFVTVTGPTALLVYRYETFVSKEPVGQGHFRCLLLALNE